MFNEFIHAIYWEVCFQQEGYRSRLFWATTGFPLLLSLGAFEA